eukprot:933445-Amphidinium_carterae.2
MAQRGSEWRRAPAGLCRENPQESLGCLYRGFAEAPRKNKIKPSTTRMCRGGRCGCALIQHPLVAEHYISTKAFPGGEALDDEEELNAEVISKHGRCGGFLQPLGGVPSRPGRVNCSSMEHGDFGTQIVLYLGGAERAAECCLSLMGTEGAVGEVYTSAVELDPAEACLALVRLGDKAAAAPGTLVGSLLGGSGSVPGRGQALRGLSPMPSARQAASSRRRGESSARESVGTPPPENRGSARPKGEGHRAGPEKCG